MAAFEEVNGWAGFDEQKDLGWIVNVKEIRDGLLSAVVEHVEVLAVQAADEFAAGVGDDDANVYAVHADANVGRFLGRLLRMRGVHKHESTGDRNHTAAARK